MVPTELLAEQHAMTLRSFLAALPVSIALLTASRTAAGRRTAKKTMEPCTADIVVGTHALIQKGIAFRDLALIVIDEQHRFGVLQRSRLLEKAGAAAGCAPDALVMTATPIPRTLALTAYGDLDLSILDGMPPGRKPVLTRHLSAGAAYACVRRELDAGRQGYIVYPLVEDSDALELKSAVREARALQASEFARYRVGLLHGRMKGPAKEAVMRDFARGEIDLLIATTVIEVGIDVPNATVMVVEHADRFGLATLHQLRGRVGRSARQSFCCLVGQPATEVARRRLRAICEIQDGFALGEADLSLRGPGEIFGVSQHGMPELRLANLLTDGPLIELAREDARGSVRDNGSDADALRAALRAAYAGRLELVRVG